MSKRECACQSGERCDSIDEDGSYCPLMQAEADYWRQAWNNASPAERKTQTEIDAELIDAGRGHLVGVS